VVLITRLKGLCERNGIGSICIAPTLYVHRQAIFHIECRVQTRSYLITFNDPIALRRQDDS